MPHPIPNSSTAKSDEGSLELTEEIMRLRAYRFFEKRGYEHGHDLEDRLRAKAEIFGGKPLLLLKRGIRTTGAGRVASRHLSVTIVDFSGAPIVWSESREGCLVSFDRAQLCEAVAGSAHPTFLRPVPTLHHLHRP